MDAGITMEKIVPDASPQNGVAERMNLTATSMARAMLLEANLSDFFWPFAIQAAFHIKCRVPHSALDADVMPFQLWHGHRATISHLRPFGVHVTARYTTSDSLPKLQPRGEAGRFVGYPRDAKGYLIWFTSSRAVRVRRDVIFHEDIPTATSSPPGDDSSPLWDDLLSGDVADKTTTEALPLTTIPYVPGPACVSCRIDRMLCFTALWCAPMRSYFYLWPLCLPMCLRLMTVIRRTYFIHTVCAHIGLTRSGYSIRPRRVHRLPLRYTQDNSEYSVEGGLRIDGPTITAVLVHNVCALNEELEIEANGHNIGALLPAILAAEKEVSTSPNPPIDDADATDPQSISEAQRTIYWGQWLAAIYEELEALKAKGVYEEVEELPRGRKAVGSKWVLHIKRNENGHIARFKARLVAKGFTQIPGQDFNFTFAPVARWDSIRSILAIAATQDLYLRHIDIKTAFLNGPLSEEIYMRKPEILGEGYWRLMKGLYGLKQAGRAWYIAFNEAFQTLGFRRTESDWSVHVRQTNTGKSMSATSVDDILLASTSKSESDMVTSEVQKLYAITDNGEVSWLLGCKVTRDQRRRTITLSQEAYIEAILRQFGMLHSNSTSTPLPPKALLSTSQCPKTDSEREEMKHVPYCTLVGKVMYLATTTRPDIAYAVRELAKFMSNYGAAH